MTVTNNSSSVIRIGDGVVTAFDFSFKTIAPNDIFAAVILNDIDLLALDQNKYTVTLNATTAGGLITFLTAPPAGQKIYIYRNTPITQQVGLSSQQRYDPKVAERVWDLLTLMVQELDTRMDRALLSAPNVSPSIFLVDLVNYRNETVAAASAAAVSAAAALAKQNSMLRDRGVWATNVAYSPSDSFDNAGNVYMTMVAHTSSTIGDDISGNKIRLWVQKGATGTGAGDMRKAENLAGVADKALAFANIGGKAVGKVALLPYSLLDPSTVIDHVKTLAINKVTNAIPSAKAVADYVDGNVLPRIALFTNTVTLSTTAIVVQNLAEWDEIEILAELTAASPIYVQTSPDNGVTWRTTGYVCGVNDGLGNQAGPFGFVALRGIGGGPQKVHMHMTQMASAVRKTGYKSSSIYTTAGGAVHVASGLYGTPEVTNAIRITTGSITAGYVEVRGIRRAQVSSTTVPLLSSTIPTDNETNVALLFNPALSFNQAIEFVTGLVTLRQNVSGVWTDIETFDVVTEVGTGNGQISIVGALLTLNPTLALAPNQEYAVRVAATAIRGINGVAFAGITNDTTFSFTTEQAEPPAFTFLTVANNVVNFSLNKPGTIHWSVDDEIGGIAELIDSGIGAYAAGNFSATTTLTEVILNLAAVPSGLRRIHFVATSPGALNYNSPQHFNTSVEKVGAPVNTSPPAIAPSAVPGDILTMVGFTFTTTSPTFGFKYQRDGVDIPGHTSVSYTGLATDVGKKIVGAVRATSAGVTSDWVFSNVSFIVRPAIAITTQPTLDAAIYVQGATVTLTLAVATNADTIGVSEFSVGGVDKRSELVVASATTRTWASGTTAPGSIRYGNTIANAFETVASAIVTATLNSAAVAVPLVMATGDWDHVNEGSGGKLTTTIITAPGNGGSAITGYDLLKDGVTVISLGRSTPGTAVTTGHSLTVSSNYVIRAVNSAGAGPWSATAKVVTASDIVAPETISFVYDATANAATVTRSESAKAYYLFNTVAAPLTGANIKSQVLAGTPLVFGTINIGTPEVIPNLAGLGAAKIVVLHQALEDASGNVEPLGVFIEYDWAGAADTVGPVLSAPTDIATGTTSCSGTVTTNEANGTLRFAVSTSVTAPTAAQIEAGQMHTGVAAAASGSQAVTTTGSKSITAIGLAAATAYYIHYFHRDAAGNPSNIVSGDGFTTDLASGAVDFIGTTQMISTTVTATSFASTTSHTVSASLNRVVVLEIRGTSDLAGAVPTIVSCTFGGVAGTQITPPTGSDTVSRNWVTAYMFVNPAAGARGCAVEISAAARALSVRAKEFSNVDQVTPVQAAGVAANVASTENIAAFVRTTTSNGNMLTSTIAINAGGYAASLVANGGATLAAADETGISGSSDVTAGSAYEPCPTAGANGHGYAWTTANRWALSWAELRRA